MVFCSLANSNFPFPYMQHLAKINFSLSFNCKRLAACFELFWATPLCFVMLHQIVLQNIQYWKIKCAILYYYFELRATNSASYMGIISYIKIISLILSRKLPPEVLFSLSLFLSSFIIFFNPQISVREKISLAPSSFH